MKSHVCEKLDIEFPLIAFTHCRDVVCEVSKAGGMGVLGAAGYGPEQLEIELSWIDEQGIESSRSPRGVVRSEARGEGPSDPP